MLLFLPEVQGLLLCWQPVVALGCEVLRRSKLDPISLVVSWSWGGDLVMNSVLWEGPPTDGWPRGGNRAKYAKTPAAFNVLGASSKGMLVDMVSVTALGQLVTMIPSGEQERVALWHDAAAFLRLPFRRQHGEEAFSGALPPGEVKHWCSETRSKADRIESFLNKHSWLLPSAANSLAS